MGWQYFTPGEGNRPLINDDPKTLLKKICNNLYNIVVQASTATWGSITGTLSDQTDLQSALDGKLGANPNIGEATGTSLDLTGAITGDGSGLAGVTETFLTSGNFLSPVWDAIGNLTESTGEVAIMTWGDSVSSGKVSVITERLQQLYGKRGIAFDACGYIAGGGATNGVDYTRWPFRIFNLTGSGQYHEFTDFINGGYAPILCNELTVFYIMESGAGNFTVTADLNGSGSYSTVTGFTSVATTNGSMIGSFTKQAITRGAYRFRVGWVSGTVRILGIRARDSVTGGIMNIQVGYSGQNLADMNDSPIAVTDPVFQEVDPTVECFEMKDALAGWQAELEAHYANLSTALPSMAWLFVGSNPVGGGGQSDADQIEMNAITKAVAVANNQAYWDGHGVYTSFAVMDAQGWIPDGVHPTSDANNYGAEKMLNDLGWHLRYDRLRVSPKKFTSDSNSSPAWVFENTGGQAQLNIRSALNFYKSLFFTNPSGNTVGVVQVTPENTANNPNALVLGGASSGIIINTSGLVKIGNINPAVALTAALEIPAGLLMMQGNIRNSASNNSSPSNGDLWHNGSINAYQTYTAGLAQTVAGTIFTGTADATYGNTSSQGETMPTGVGTTTLPANWWAAGRTIILEASGYYSTDVVAPTLTALLRMGGTNIANSGAITMPSAITNRAWKYRGIYTCRTIGATGTIQCQGDAWFDNALGGFTLAIPTTTTTVFDTTATIAIPRPRWTWGTADSDNTMTLTNMRVSALN